MLVTVMTGKGGDLAVEVFPVLVWKNHDDNENTGATIETTPHVTDRFFQLRVSRKHLIYLFILKYYLYFFDSKEYGLRY